jgi:hypothetical protein
MEGHEFYKSHMNRCIFCPGNKIADLILIQALHDDNIYFHMKIFPEEQVDITHDGCKLVAAGDEFKPVGLQGIQANIKRTDIGFLQHIYEFMEPGAIGGKGSCHRHF